VQQRAVEPRVTEVETQGIFPIHAAADGIGRLPIGEPFHILHHDDERQAPGGHFHGTTLGGIEIGKELIVIERAKLCAQVHIKVAFGKGGPHCSRSRVWNGWEGFGAYAHGVPPGMTMMLGLTPSIAHQPRERPPARSPAVRRRLSPVSRSSHLTPSVVIPILGLL
jgi:hypothetical protein